MPRTVWTSERVNVLITFITSSQIYLIFLFSFAEYVQSAKHRFERNHRPKINIFIISSAWSPATVPCTWFREFFHLNNSSVIILRENVEEYFNEDCNGDKVPEKLLINYKTRVGWHTVAYLNDSEDGNRFSMVFMLGFVMFT